MLKQQLLRMKIVHNDMGLGNPVRSISLDEVQRKTAKSFIDRSGRKTELRSKEINKMLRSLLNSVKNGERVKINILQIEKDKVKAKVLLSKPLRCVQNRGANSEFSMQNNLCCQPVVKALWIPPFNSSFRDGRWGWGVRGGWRKGGRWYSDLYTFITFMRILPVYTPWGSARTPVKIVQSDYLKVYEGLPVLM